MRYNEISTRTELDEDWRKAATAAALATGMGLGGLAYKQVKQPAATAAQAVQQTVQQAPVPEIKDLRTMSAQDIGQFIQDKTRNIAWAPNEFRQFMAQVMHETHNLSQMSENLYYKTPQRIYKHFTSSFRSNPELTSKYANNPRALANRVYANRMGNGDEASGDGWRYRGRGLLHITGKEMYNRVGRGIGVDLVQNPDLLSTDADVSLRAALWYWKNIVRPKVGQKFHDTKQVTKAINPALAGIEKRKQQYQQQPKQP